MNLKELIEKVLKLVEEVGSYLSEAFYSAFGVYRKKQIEIVTTVDYESERMITEGLKKLTPEFEVIGEESFSEERIRKAGRYYWLIDPLDGTVNFIHHIPWFAVSLALMQEKEPILGIVYNPVGKECFYAIKGEGAYLDGKPIKVSEEEELENSLLCTSFPGACKVKGFEKCLVLFKEFNIISQGVRRFGAAALDLAYVACGRYEGFWEPYLKPWDTAAGMLLVKEAGGEVTDYFGKPYHPFLDSIVASNKRIHSKLLEFTSKYHPDYL